MFVGRRNELELIGRCVEAAAGGRAQAVWVEGEAGSGKSALVRQVIAGLPAGFQVLRAEADELATDVSLAVAAQLGPLAATSAFAAGLELLELLSRWQDDGPVAVLVEDMHWADDTSRQALLTAARRLREDRVVMLLTSRPEAGGSDGWDRFCLDQERCRRIVLGPLSGDEVAELARQSGVSIDKRAAERLHGHTEGHPLYVRTLLSELTVEQLTSPDRELSVPRSLASTTIARLAEVPTEARALASALAVLNDRVPLNVAARVGGIKAAAPALGSLLETGFFRWWPGEPQTPVEFAHPLFRMAVYEDLSPILRQELHWAAAGVLPSGPALAHRVAAADTFDDALADELADAALPTRGPAALETTVKHLLWASSLSSCREQSEQRLLEANRRSLTDGQTVRAVGLRPRVEGCRDSPLRSLVLGMLAWQEGDAAAAEGWLGRAVGEIHGCDVKADVVVDALCQLAAVYVTQGRAQEAVEAATRALAGKPGNGRVEQSAWATLALGEGMLRGAPAGLDRLRERLPHDAQAVRQEDCDLLITRGTLGFYAGRTTAAAADLRAVIGLVRRGSVAVQLPRAHLHLSDLLFSLGDWDEASLHARVALSMVSDEQRVWMAAQVHANLAVLLAVRGEWLPAEEQVAAAREAAAASGIVEAVFKARIAEGRLAQARNDPRGVVGALAPLAGGGESEAIPMLSSLGWWPPLIAATLDLGHLDRAEAQVAQLERAAHDRRLDFGARLLGLRARLSVARGRPDDAAAAFAAAIELLGVDDPVLDRALLHHAYGRLLHARGNRRGAVDHLRAAQELLDRVGAEPFRKPVQTDMEACGIRAPAPADRFPRGPSPLALTDRERDVAVLVARGMTNREVAAELYVSAKAVEYHLRNVFAKLGVSSRRALRDRRFD